tara:strand:- start:1956 stop:2306 length:351 start_codon:yes stop_codon:yes gene_type:complete
VRANKMAINWNVGKCKNYKKLVKGDEATLTDALIWGGFDIGYGQITNKNWKQYYKRVQVIEKLFGSYVYTYNDNSRTPYYLTEKDIKKRIGLSTNHSNISNTKFWKKIKDRVEKEF